jgi:hypothetical protein
MVVYCRWWVHLSVYPLLRILALRINGLEYFPYLPYFPYFLIFLISLFPYVPYFPYVPISLFPAHAHSVLIELIGFTTAARIV